MATQERTPLLVCMQNGRGEDVTLEVVPGDDFRTFLDKAKELLGFEIDVSCITQCQVSLSEDIYYFLINADPEQLNPAVVQEDPESARQLLATHNQSEPVYTLGDGEVALGVDESPKFDVEKIPYVKYANVEPERVELSPSSDVMKMVTIRKSPSRPYDTVNLPFRPVAGHKYESGHFTRAPHPRHRQKRMSKFDLEMQPQYGINYSVGCNISRLMSDRVQNVQKDSPVVKTIEFIEEDEKQKHVRKTSPYKLPINQSSVDVEISIRRGDSGSNYCFICNTLIQNHLDEIYLFDNEDQKAYRSSPKREQATPLKVICNSCVNVYFMYSLELLTEKTLEVDEYLIIRRNQQYLYKRVLPLPQRAVEKLANEEANSTEQQIVAINKDIDEEASVIEDNVNTELSDLEENKPDVKPNIEIDFKSDGIRDDVEIVNKGNDTETELNAEEYNEVEFLEDLDDCVVVEQKELKCRFCSNTFPNLDEAVEHGTEHWLIKEKVFPCPLCEYGYQTFVWLRGHMYSKHRTDKESKESNHQVPTPTPSDIASLCNSDDQSRNQSPVANRTRNSAGRKRPASGKKKDKNVKKTKRSKKQCKSKKDPTSDEISSENVNVIRQKDGITEVNGADDEQLWIVQCGVSEISSENVNVIRQKDGITEVNGADDEQLWIVQCGVSNKNPKECKKTRIYPCPVCKKRFISRETLACHVARKCKNPNIIVKNTPLNCLAKRCEWKPKYATEGRVGSDADPDVMTCNDCGATFTSKVRLKFHVQFHTPTALLTPGGRFLCERCPPDSSFATESELYDHVHFTHEKRTRYACPVPGCDKSFFLRAMLTKHGRTHTNTRRYICSECGKRFLDKQTLDEHSVTHLKRKPFECHICGKQLTRRSRFRMHLKAHEEFLTPRPVHACRLCSRAFKDRLEAKEHVTNSHCGGETVESVNSGDTELNVLLRRTDSEETKSMIKGLSDDTRGLITIVEVDKVFRCEYCENVFYLPERLNEHRTLHRDVEEPFICHICGVAFPTYSRCTTHKTTHGYYRRSLNAKSSRSGGGEPEMGPSASRILGYGDFPVAKHFLCGDCGRTYLHWTYFQVHRRMKHPTGEEVYTCAECGLVYPHSWALAYHRRKVHSGNASNDIMENSRPKSNLKIPCRDCEEVFRNQSALYTHRRKVHTGLVPRQGKHLGLFSCATCKKCYSNKLGLEAHLRGVPSPCAPAAAPYACARCGTTFAYSEHLARHIMDVHAEAATHMCSTCGATFASRAELVTHARSHPPLRAHACPVCARVFRSASNCSEHLRVHTGERPFPCDLCGMSFRRSTARNNHRLIHTGERAFRCERCPKTFRIRSDLRAHVRNQHPERVLVIEMRGLNPAPEDVIQQLLCNGITLENVADISKVSFPKGNPNLVLSGDSASLESLQSAQQVCGSRLWSERVKVAIAERLPKCDAALSCAHGNQQALKRRRGRGTSRCDGAKHGGSREAHDADLLHVAIKDVAVEELNQLLGGVLTSDGKGVLLTSGEFVPFSAVLSEESKLALSEQSQHGDSLKLKNRTPAAEETRSAQNVERKGVFVAARSNTQEQAHTKYGPYLEYKMFNNILPNSYNQSEVNSEQNFSAVDEEAERNRSANEFQTEHGVGIPVDDEKTSDQYNIANCVQSQLSIPIFFPEEDEKISEQCRYTLSNSEITQTNYYSHVSGNTIDSNMGMHECTQSNSSLMSKTSSRDQSNMDGKEYCKTNVGTPRGSEMTEPNQNNMESGGSAQPIMYNTANENITDQYRYCMQNNDSHSNLITPEGTQTSEQQSYNSGNNETSQPNSYVLDGSGPYQYNFESNVCQANLHTERTLQGTWEHQYSMRNETFQTNLAVPDGRINSDSQYNLETQTNDYEHYQTGNNVTPVLYNLEGSYDHYGHRSSRSLEPNFCIPESENTSDHNQNNTGNNEIAQPVFYDPSQNSEQYAYSSGNNVVSRILYAEGSTMCHL